MIRSRLFFALVSAALATQAFGQATLPAVGTNATLPPGHPSMDQLTAGAATQPAITGSLTVTLQPGTAGATLTANEPVTIELYHRNARLKKYDLQTDAQGTVQIPDLPIMPPVQALVSVKHAGLLQQIVTPEINPSAPAQTLQMKVYETTETLPVWKVAMQHMIVHWDTEKNVVHVIEMISTSTDGDRAWLGANAPTGRITMIVPLPQGAQQVELGDGFTEQATHLVDGSLVSGDALFPGRAEYRFSYFVPIVNGSARLSIAPPAAADNLIVFAPADGATIQATGLNGGDVVDAGDGKVRMYRAEHLAQGAPVALSISNITAPAAEVPVAVAPVVASPSSARNVAVGGAFLLVIVGGAMMLIKKPQPRKA